MTTAATVHGAKGPAARRRAAAAGLAVVAVAPAALFLFAAIGRSLQPVEHQPARTLQAIVDAFAGLPGAANALLLGVLPTLALVLAAWAAWASLRDDAAARSDLADVGRAVARAATHPTLVASLLALAGGLAIIAVLTVHAIVG